MAKQNNKRRIIARFGYITAAMLALAGWIVYDMTKTTIIQADQWNRRAELEMSRVDTIAPERGNILAANGHILACNLKVYDILIDLRHDRVKKLKAINWLSVDSLADSLDLYYPRHGGQPWKEKLHLALEKDPNKRTRALKLVSKGTTMDYDRVRTWPFINQFSGKGAKQPLYKTERDIRMYPYGRMALRSIGRVNENEHSGQIHGYSGLERDLDSLLYGQPGFAKRVALTNGIGNWVTKAPQRGYDIRTTIDIDIQDILEEELIKVCQESNAEWGTAIIMEVETGEIKGISNVELLADGTYGEALNRAVQAYEPGSVMKPISLMIAFEDGLVKNVTDRVETTPFMKTSDHHGANVKNMKEVIEMSSNTGIARVIFRGYADHPEKFYDRLASIGFFEPMRTGIYGECTPRIRRLEDHDKYGNPITMTARRLDLARQAYGYATELPPLYTLSIYNALANGGKYVRPHLVRGLHSETVDSIFPIDYIRPRICSEETAAKVRECIREVVWGSHGTARRVQDDRVEIAGKTGTAFPVGPMGYDKSKRRYAFAGFFPYSAPRYSCMALILAPGGHGAGTTSGYVVKNVALKLFARGMLDNQSTYNHKADARPPLLAAANDDKAAHLAGELGISRPRVARTHPTADQNVVPDVKGYDPASAVAILEKKGMRVRMHGAGVVAAQQPAPGTPLSKGQQIILTLKTLR